MLLHQLIFLDASSVHLRDFIFYFVCSISFLVFTTLIASMIIFQKPKIHFGVEVIWAVIPFVMLLVMMIPVVNIFIYQ
jgi:hypothetical protein